MSDAQLPPASPPPSPSSSSSAAAPAVGASPNPSAPPLPKPAPPAKPLSAPQPMSAPPLPKPTAPPVAPSRPTPTPTPTQPPSPKASSSVSSTTPVSQPPGGSPPTSMPVFSPKPVAQNSGQPLPKPAPPTKPLGSTQVAPMNPTNQPKTVPLATNEMQPPPSSLLAKAPVVPGAPQPPARPPMLVRPGVPPVGGQPPTARIPGAPIGPTGLARPTSSAQPIPPAGAGGGPQSGVTSSAAPPAPPKMAEVKRSPLRFLPFVLGGVVLFGIAFFIFSRIFGGGQTPSTQTNVQVSPQTSKQVTLTYWGLWEPSPVLQEVITSYEQAHPGVKIVYQQQSSKDYRERLQTAITSGRGPDIFRFHASWVPMLRQELSPMPESVMSLAQFDSTFYPIATQQLKLGNQLMGIPLMTEGLGLYYNEEVLRTANVQPPKTWAEVKTLASQLTIRDGNKIQRAGMAIGNASNVEHFADILALLMLQNGAKLDDPTSQAAQDALTFYTNFVRTDRVWDATLPSSTTAFARGDVAMMLAPSWRAHDVKALNPNLKFSIAPAPQLAGNKLTWGSFWAEGVSSQSKSKPEAWEFLKYLSSAEAMRKFHAAADKQRTFGEIYSRRDLASEISSDPMMGAFVSDAPAAQGWYMSSYTHDNGINDQIIKYYADAINAYSGSSSNDKAIIETLSQGIAQVLRQYGLSAATAVTTTTSR